MSCGASSPNNLKCTIEFDSSPYSKSFLSVSIGFSFFSHVSVEKFNFLGKTRLKIFSFWALDQNFDVPNFPKCADNVYFSPSSHSNISVTAGLILSIRGLMESLPLLKKDLNKNRVLPSLVRNFDSSRNLKCGTDFVPNWGSNCFLFTVARKLIFYQFPYRTISSCRGRFREKSNVLFCVGSMVWRRTKNL